ncbi:MAG: hypothetical protein ABIH67_01980 [Candidatus Uhrbacteria bacterium]
MDRRAEFKRLFVIIFQGIKQDHQGDVTEEMVWQKLEEVESQAVNIAVNSGLRPTIASDATQLAREAASEVFGFDLTHPAPQRRH